MRSRSYIRKMARTVQVRTENIGLSKISYDCRVHRSQVELLTLTVPLLESVHVLHVCCMSNMPLKFTAEKAVKFVYRILLAAKLVT